MVFFEFYHRENTDFFTPSPRCFLKSICTYIYMYAFTLICVMKFILLCVCMCVFPNQHSAVSLPDSVVRFWCLNSLAWPENGNPFTAWHLLPFLIQLSPVPCKVHGPVTPDQFHPFNMPGMFMLLSFAQHMLLEVPKWTSFPFPQGKLCLSL